MTEVTEQNRIIGEFLGYTFYDEGLTPCMILPDKSSIPVANLKYHEDWSALMGVVEKIEQLNDEVVKKIYTSISGKSCSLWNYFDVKGILRADSDLNCPFSKRFTGKTKIEATHKAVYEFVIWYNSVKQSPTP